MPGEGNVYGQRGKFDPEQLSGEQKLRIQELSGLPAGQESEPDFARETRAGRTLRSPVGGEGGGPKTPSL